MTTEHETKESIQDEWMCGYLYCDLFNRTIVKRGVDYCAWDFWLTSKDSPVEYIEVKGLKGARWEDIKDGGNWKPMITEHKYDKLMSLMRREGFPVTILFLFKRCGTLCLCRLYEGMKVERGYMEHNKDTETKNKPHVRFSPDDLIVVAKGVTYGSNNQ